MSDFFKNVNDIKWFSNCGKEFIISDFPIKIQFLNSLNEMQINVSSQKWGDVTLEARNRLTVFLHKKRSTQYQDWNKITEIQKKNLKFIEEIVRNFVKNQDLGKELVDDVLWNTLGAGMEYHYHLIDKKTPLFFKYLLEIYSMGNIPCGWVGEVEEDDNGKQIDFSKCTLLVY